MNRPLPETSFSAKRRFNGVAVCKRVFNDLMVDHQSEDATIKQPSEKMIKITTRTKRMIMVVVIAVINRETNESKHPKS